jgi:dipeptidase D
MQLISLHGGTAHNAIPREAVAMIAIPDDKKEEADKVISSCVDDFANEYLNFESGIEGALTQVDAIDNAIEAGLSERILRFMLAFPNGMQALDPSVYDGGKLIAETSNNFAVIRTDDEAVRILSSQRSQVMSSRDRMTQQIEMVAHLAGAEYKSGNGYASWQPNWDSALLATTKRLYHDMFGKEPVVNVVHGGLECGVIGSKHEGMDMISLGPTIENPHSPDERMYIPSIKQVWDFLTKLLVTL